MAQVAIKKVSYSDPASFARDVHAAFSRQGLGHESALILTAHVALSTGWGRAMDNYRLAGIKAGADCVCSGGCAAPARPYTCVTGYEVVNGQKVYAKMAWRAYASLDEGAAAVVELLRATRYQRSWAWLAAGDTRYFRQLGADGWYTASPDEVESACLSILKKLRTYIEAPSGAGPILGWVLAGGGLVLGITHFKDTR